MKLKIFILILLIGFINSKVEAQACEEAMELTYNLFKDSKIDEAILKGEETCLICKEHKLYTTFLLFLANLNIQKSDFKKAEILFKAVSKSQLGENDQDYATGLNGLADLNTLQGLYTSAEPLYLKALSIRKNIFGESHPSYILSLNNLAYLYSLKERYAEAELMYTKSLSLNSSIYGENHQACVVSLNNLGYIYENQGSYLRAEYYYEKALSVNKLILGETHPDYATSLNNLATLYQRQGDYNNAELLLQQALATRKIALGETHPKYATSLNNLANLYIHKNNYNKAEPLLIEAKKIRKLVQGEFHPDYAIVLNNMAYLKLMLGEYSNSEQLYIEGLAIVKGTYGENNSHYVSTLNNLAFLYAKQGFYLKAEPLHKKALNIGKSLFSETNLEYFHLLNNLAGLYKEQSNHNKAEPYLQKSSYIFQFNNKYILSYLSQKQSIEYLNNSLKEEEALHSQIINYPASTLKDSMLNYTYFIKGALMQNSNRLSKAVNNNTDAKVQENWATYKDKKRYIAQLYQLPKEKQIELVSTQEEADKLEKWLMQNVPEFKEALNNNKIRWQDVQQNLKPNEASIEFVNFRYQNKKWTDTIICAAYVVKKGIKQPIFISCFNELELEAALNKNNAGTDISKLYNASVENTSNKLYNLIWQPLESVLQGMRTIYISPSGLLHKISFAALLAPSNKRLMELYELHVMNNTRALAENKKAISEPTSVALLGGIDYDLEATNNLPNTDVTVLTDNGIKTLRNGSMSAWSYLVATNKEVEDLKLLLRTNNKIATTYTGTNATEELIKSMGLGKTTVPSILHIATHGYALAEPKQPKYEDNQFRKEKTTPLFYVSEDAFTRSGLILAGANKMWTTGKPFSNKEDGILTAREIMELDLSACQLAVLSACETGLGKLAGNEGVNGLEKAFKMAGVKNTIVSLWQVPDAETREFMQLFYTNWLAKKMDMYAAFNATQTTLSSKYDVQKWGAFVLMQ